MRACWERFRQAEADYQKLVAERAERTHTVQRGEWLWKIARSRLRAADMDTSRTAVKGYVDAIHLANRAVIGSRPNRLTPGQVIVLPGLPLPPAPNPTSF